VSTVAERQPSSSAVSPARGWKPASWLLVRSTGFPFELLESLRSSAPDVEDEDAQAEATARALGRLLEIAADERFREALFLSNPGVHEVIERWLATDLDPGRLNSKSKLRARTLAMYLQRFCSKNESVSFFGPTYWGRLGGSDDASVTIAPAPTPEPRRFVFWSHWAVQKLADLIAADPEVWRSLHVARPPWLFERDGGYRKVDFLPHPPELREVEAPEDPRDERLVELCHRGGRLGDVVAETEVEDLRRLAERDLVQLGLQAPVGLPRPLDHLLAEVDGFDEPARSRWSSCLQELDELRRRFEETDLSERIDLLARIDARFEELTAASSTRGAGELAADRAVIFEDCHQPWSAFEVGGRLERDLRREFPLVLDLVLELPLARVRARRQAALEWFVDRFGAGARVALDAAFAAAADPAAPLDPILRGLDEEVVEHGDSLLSDALYGNADRRLVELDPDDVRSALGPPPKDVWGLCSADLQVGAASADAIETGDYHVVVGEVHALHDVLLYASVSALHPRPGEFLAEISELTDGLSAATVCDSISIHWGKTAIRAASALPDVEFVGRSPKPDALRLQAHDLAVEARDDRLALLAPGLGEIALAQPPTWLWADEVGSLFGAFSGVRLTNMGEHVRRRPAELTHLPRVCVGRFVVARETWWLDPDAVERWSAYAPANRQALRRQQLDHGLPDLVYAKFEEEQKPVFLDFANPLLVDVAARLWAATEGPVRVTEMLPGPDELWLADRRGRYTSELRIGFYRPDGSGR
jgi:hypothetical protein